MASINTAQDPITPGAKLTIITHELIYIPYNTHIAVPKENIE
jgi:hypothetical protein